MRLRKRLTLLKDVITRDVLLTKNLFLELLDCVQRLTKRSTYCLPFTPAFVSDYPVKNLKVGADVAVQHRLQTENGDSGEVSEAGIFVVQVTQRLAVAVGQSLSANRLHEE